MDGQNSIRDLDSWISQYIGGVVKTAAEDSKSSHPSASVDDGTKPATTGSRAAENAKDVAAQQPAATPENAPTPSATASSPEGAVAKDNRIHSGTCDELSNIGTASAKDKKDVPPTAGPKDMEKTSAQSLLKQGKSVLEKMAALMTAAPAVTKAAACAAPAKPGQKAEKKPEQKPAEAAAEAAEDTTEDDSEMAKKAGAAVAEQMAKEAGLIRSEDDDANDLVGMVKQAGEQAAVNVLAYLRAMAKSAGEEIPELAGDAAAAEAAPSGGAAMAAMAGGDPAMAAASGAGQVSPEELAAAIESGDIDPQTLQLIAQVLEEMGITPEALAGAPVEEKADSLNEKKAAIFKKVKSLVDTAAASIAAARK